MNKGNFNRLMEELRPKMYRFALSYTGRVDDAEDAVQDVALKLWEKRSELAAVRSMEAYAMTAVRNHCLDSLRSAHNSSELMEAQNIVHEQTPHKALELTDMVAYVKRLIKRLPEQQQAVIRLRDIEGYALDEIAIILCMNEGAVRANLSRARQKIREELLKHIEHE